MMSITNAPLVLASGSPRRVDLLAQLGVSFQTIDPRLEPEAQAVKIAERKARAVASQLEAAILLGADTMVALDGDLLGKPMDEADATRMLRRFNGLEHLVATGVVILDSQRGKSRHSAVTNRVRFRDLGDDEIAACVATGEPRDEAGAYAIQGRGRDLIAMLDGCFTYVVGLPMCTVSELLSEAGVIQADDANRYRGSG